MHSVSKEWELRSFASVFSRFSTPHTEEAAPEMLYNALTHSEIIGKVHTITMSNANDFYSEAEALNVRLREEKHVKSNISDYHERCIAQDNYRC